MPLTFEKFVLAETVFVSSYVLIVVSRCSTFPHTMFLWFTVSSRYFVLPALAILVFITLAWDTCFVDAEAIFGRWSFLSKILIQTDQSMITALLLSRFND
ncbi:hypothetical protein V6N13_043354 [Hibiscus sabdariffa]|uniref:Uncharacterized protein n=1 Tax=Hibiscus sabdariffa TaxID=183260 RepID=A0ABR2G2F4_9ROSI